MVAREVDKVRERREMERETEMEMRKSTHHRPPLGISNIWS